MSFGICMLSHVPCRKEPSDRSEMVTQLLFGEYFEIVEEEAKWYKIKIAFDGYECWVCKKQVVFIEPNEFERLNSHNVLCSKELVSVVNIDGTYLPVVLGSSLPFFNDGIGEITKKQFSFDGSTSEITAPQKSNIIQDAFMYLNAPYLWGGKSPFGIDCSGFTQMVYKMNNVKLPRDAYQQAVLGESYSFVEEAEPGDLAFFDNEEGHIIHVGILLQDKKIIHASGKVRIDSLDHQGIFNAETNSYSHKLRIIKKVI